MPARTPAKAFYVPILRCLVNLGGSGLVDDVCDRIKREVGHTFNECDRESIQTHDEPRWRNTVRWARKDLTMMGLLAKDSPRGTWEITEDGRRFLKIRAQSSTSQPIRQVRGSREPRFGLGVY
jgi:hypothetical protein